MAAGGLMYTASFANISVTNVVQDIWQITSSTTCSLLIHSWRLTFTPTIVSGVAQDVRLTLQILTRTTAGSGGTAVTPKPVNPRNTIAATSVWNRTTVTTQGTAANVIDNENVSVIVPFERIYTPDQRIPLQVLASYQLCLFLTATNAALPLNASSEVYFEEI